MNKVLQQPTLYDRIDKIVVTALKWLSYVSAVFLVAIMFIAFFNVVGEKLRKIGVSFASGIKSSTEIIQYFHIPLVFLSAAYVTLDHGHTSIDLVTSHFPIKVRRGLRAFGYLLGAAVSGFISYRTLFVLMPKHISTFSTINGAATGWPVWPFSLMQGIGFFALAISFIWAIVRTLTGHDNLVPKTEVKTEAAVSDAAEVEIEPEGGAE